MATSAPDMTPIFTYAEPTVMWRLRHKDGRVANAIIVPQGARAYAAWFILGHLEQGQHLESWHDAITWIESVRLTLKSEGWRPRR